MPFGAIKIIPTATLLVDMLLQLQQMIINDRLVARASLDYTSTTLSVERSAQVLLADDVSHLGKVHYNLCKITIKGSF